MLESLSTSLATSIDILVLLLRLLFRLFISFILTLFTIFLTLRALVTTISSIDTIKLLELSSLTRMSNKKYDRQLKKAIVSKSIATWILLSLILGCRIIEHLIYIEKKIEIVEINNRFLFEKNAKIIFIDKKIDVLIHSQH